MKAEEAVKQIIAAEFTDDEIQIIHEYARIQIEKDRDNVILNTPLEKRLELIRRYSITPITLD